MQITLHRGEGGRVVLLDGEREQFVRIPQAIRELVEPGDDLLEPGALLAQSLCPLGVVPDVRLLQLALDLGQPFGVPVVVKDTSSTHPRVQ